MADPVRRSNRPRGGRARVLDPEPPGEELDCTCCEPPSPLVLRPDMGCLSDGSAEYALCVLHQPEPTVYRNRGDGQYEQVPGLRLSPSGDIVDGNGALIARVESDDFQRLSTVDDDEDEPDRGGAAADDPCCLRLVD